MTWFDELEKILATQFEPANLGSGDK